MAAAPTRLSGTRAGRFGRVWLAGLALAAGAAFVLPNATNAADNESAAPTTDNPADDYIPTTTIGDRSVQINALAPECIADVPYIRYAITPTGFSSSGPATLSFYDRNGTFVESRIVSSLSGTTIFPGASANPPRWPGWKRAENGNWIPDDSDAILREGLTVRVSLGAEPSVTLEATGNVSFPPSSARCYGPPGNRSLDVSAFTPICIAEAPFIDYAIVPVGFSSTGPATLTFYDKNGNFVEQRTVSSLSGRTIYPGASVDANGNTTDWPGWKQAENGNWIPDDSDAILRDGLKITVSIDAGADQPQGLVFVEQTILDATATVSYPPATSPCANPPEGTPPTTTICVGTSTSTGGGSPTTTDPCQPPPPCVPGTSTGGSSSSSTGGGENCEPPCVPGTSTGGSSSSSTGGGETCEPPPCVPATTVAGSSATPTTVDPACSLPRTGSDGVRTLMTIGGVALAAGALITLLARRRKPGAATPV